MAENVEMGTSIDYKVEYEKLQAEQTKLKASFDKTASEVASYKKQLAEKQTDEEKKQTELAERENYYKQIERENTKIKMSSRLAKTIKDEKVLNEIADLYADGKTLEALEKQTNYYANSRAELEKEIKAELLKNNPNPPPSNSNSSITKEQFDKMNVQERTKLYNENIELYNKLRNN